ncbi:MAG: ribokinase [Chloroflexota bacterium]
MNRRPKVTVIGSFNTDLAARTPRMPVKGETILGGPFHMGPGGKGANQAVAAARLGAEVTMVVKIGKDVFGDLAEANLVKEGIRSDFVLRTEETHTGAALIILDADGENMIVVAGGANNLLLPEDVDMAHEAIAQADILLVQLEIPLETVERAIRLATEARVQVLLNPAPGRPLRADLLSLVDVLTPNETETQTITGLPVRDWQEVETAAQQLLGSGVGIAVITLGVQGALVVTPQGVQHVPGHQVKVVDTTGAGDAFSGALAVALAEERDIAEAVAFANAAAALNVTRVGTAPAMPYRDEVDSMLTS